MQQHVVRVGMVLAFVASAACGAVPEISYYDDLDGGSQPDATTPTNDSGAADTSTTTFDAVVARDSGCGNVGLPPGFVCCNDGFCKSDSCESDICRGCAALCSFPQFCCVDRRGGGDKLRCLADPGECR